MNRRFQRCPCAEVIRLRGLQAAWSLAIPKVRSWEPPVRRVAMHSRAWLAASRSRRHVEDVSGE